MTHLSLFTGIGGLDLAAEWAGFQTVGQCEWAEYPTKVLEKHWSNTPRWRDIRTLTKESFYEKTGLHSIDVLSGGFPCQPFSVAGKQKGKRDDRYLWPEMLRVIRELAPRWVVGENVPGILRIAGRTVCEDLEREGYAVAIFNFEAAAVGAPHRRARCFFVANARHDVRTDFQEPRDNGQGSKHNAQRPEGSVEPSGSSRCQRGHANVANTTSGATRNDGNNTGQIDRKIDTSTDASIPSGTEKPDVPDANSIGSREGEYAVFTAKRNQTQSRSSFSGADVSDALYNRSQKQRQEPKEPSAFTTRDWWTVEPDVGRVAYGVPARVDRLKCIGNAVVRQQAYPIFKAIADVMRNDAYDQ